MRGEGVQGQPGMLLLGWQQSEPGLTGLVPRLQVSTVTISRAHVLPHPHPKPGAQRSGLLTVGAPGGKQEPLRRL